MIGAPDTVTSQSLVGCVSCKLLEELIDHPRVGHQEGKLMSALSNCLWLVVCCYSSNHSATIIRLCCQIPCDSETETPGCSLSLSDLEGMVRRILVKTIYLQCV